MKATTMILMVAGALAVQTQAASPNSSASAYVNIQKTASQPKGFWIFRPKAPAQDKIYRVGGISSRPWAQIAGRTAPSPFVDQRGFGQGLKLFSISF